MMKAKKMLGGVNMRWDLKGLFGKGLALVAVMLLMAICLAGCLPKEREKVRDLDALILSEEVLPTDVKQIIEGKKAQPFQFTYSDKKNLYICIGYGKQDRGGYSIALNELYLTDAEVVVSTTLLGPSADEQAKKTATYPYIVIQTELVEQPVVFE